MNETSKAMRRRWCEDELGIFPWRSIFKGVGLDVGAGNDPVPLEGFIAFDQKDGDANDLTKYYKPATFDVLHASQVLEHMHNPVKAFVTWAHIVKPGGWIVITVPAMELYGDLFWFQASKYNPDHKSTWSMGLKKSGSPQHLFVHEFVSTVENICGVTCRLSRVVDTNYDYGKMFTVDQTFDECDMVEAWIEMAFEKHNATRNSSNTTQALSKS